VLIVKFGKGSSNNQQPRLAAQSFMLEPVGLCWCYRMRQLLNLICLLFFFASSWSEQILRGLRAGTATSLRKNFPTSPSTAGPCGSGLLALDGYRSDGDKDFEAKKKDVDPSLLQVVTVDQAGFIEPFAPLNRGDNEIPQHLRHLPQPTATRFFATSTSSWSRRRHNRPHPGSNFVSPELPIHAVFISGLPKLPCPKLFRLSFRPGYTYNAVRYQALSSSSFEPSLAHNLY
jgi:hypothetical protein